MSLQTSSSKSSKRWGRDRPFRRTRFLKPMKVSRSWMTSWIVQGTDWQIRWALFHNAGSRSWPPVTFLRTSPTSRLIWIFGTPRAQLLKLLVKRKLFSTMTLISITPNSLKSQTSIRRSAFCWRMTACWVRPSRPGFQWKSYRRTWTISGTRSRNFGLTSTMQMKMME